MTVEVSTGPTVVATPGASPIRFGNALAPRWDAPSPPVVVPEPRPRLRDRRTLVAAIAGGLALAIVATFLLTREAPPPPASLRLGFEAGRTYPLRYRAIGDEHLRIGDRRLPWRTEVTGVVALRIDHVDATGLASFTARLEAPQVVINGKPLTVSVMKTKGKIDRRGVLMEGGSFRLKGGSDVPLVVLSMTPALPDETKLLGTEWATDESVRAATALDRYSLTARFVRYEDEAATRAVVEGSGVGVVKDHRGRGRVDTSSQAVLDPATGLFLKASETSSLDINVKAPATFRRLGRRLTIVGTWMIELERLS